MVNPFPNFFFQTWQYRPAVNMDLRSSETWIHGLVPPLSGWLTVPNHVTPLSLNFLT